MTALTQLSVDPSSAARRNAALTAVTSALNSISAMAANVQALAQGREHAIDDRRIHRQRRDGAHLRTEHQDQGGCRSRAITPSGLFDQRDIADRRSCRSISTSAPPSRATGGCCVALGDGTSLISDVSSELRYSGPTAVVAVDFVPADDAADGSIPRAATTSDPALALEGRIRGWRTSRAAGYARQSVARSCRAIGRARRVARRTVECHSQQ